MLLQYGQFEKVPVPNTAAAQKKENPKMGDSQVFPTRMALTTFKAKRVGAKKGFELLKKKSDALKVRFRDLMKELGKTKGSMSGLASDAFFSLTQAQYAAGDIKNKVMENASTASVHVVSKTDNVAGVKLPVFSEVRSEAEATDNLGLGGGGRQIQNCREKFSSLLEAMIKIASLQTSFIALDEALKVTNRRVNALDNVTIPRIEGIISFILRELDELEREDFTRLKKMQSKKAERQAEQDLVDAAAKAEAGGEADGPQADILSSFAGGDDEDVVF